MAESFIMFQRVSFAYSRAVDPLIVDLSVTFGRGWTGIVGANGAGKSTLLKLAAGILQPQQGQITIPGEAIYCEQRTDNVPHHLHDLIMALDRDASRIKGQLDIKTDWVERWATLSHGERKRAQIAAALWKSAEALVLDEPSNHLDVRAQDLLFEALAGFQGIGILVSHDRQLLDGLCQRCLFLDPPDAVLRPGNYSQGRKEAAIEEVTARREQARAKQELEKLRQEAAKRRDAAFQADRKRSKRGLAPGDHDTRARINLARVSGKDGAAGKKLNQLAGRLSHAQTKLENIRVGKDFEMGIWVPGALSRRNTLFSIPGGSLSLGGNRRLDFPGLWMKPDDRIALTGVNGCGKSTLVRYIMQALNLPEELVTYIPQEIDADASRDILTRVRTLPREKLGRLLTVVSRLGSRPERLLATDQPSPGEIRKILLATGIATAVHLIIMDEPTNHLDLPSIECLEEALVDCPCGLLLVSHDRRFLDALTRKRWQIAEDPIERSRYVLSEL